MVGGGDYIVGNVERFKDSLPEPSEKQPKKGAGKESKDGTSLFWGRADGYYWTFRVASYSSFHPAFVFFVLRAVGQFSSTSCLSLLKKS